METPHDEPIDVEYTILREDGENSAKRITADSTSPHASTETMEEVRYNQEEVGAFLTSKQKDAYYAAQEYAKCDAEKGDIAWQKMVTAFEGMVDALQLTEKALHEDNRPEIAKQHKRMHRYAVVIDGLLTLHDNTPDIPLDFRKWDRLETLSILLKAVLDAKLWPGETAREGKLNKILGAMRYGARYAIGLAMIEKYPTQRSTAMEPENRSKDRHILEQKLAQVENAKIAGRRAELKGAAKLLGLYMGYRIAKGIVTYPFSEADFEEVMDHITVTKKERRIYVGIPSGYEDHVGIYWSAEEADGSTTYEKVRQLENDGSFIIPNRIRSTVEVTVYIEYKGHRVEGLKKTVKLP